MRQVQPLIPVALYARVSSDRQDVDLSVAAQPRAWCDYAKDNGYTVTRSTCTRPRVGAPLTGPVPPDDREGGKSNAPFQVILDPE